METKQCSKCGYNVPIQYFNDIQREHVLKTGIKTYTYKSNICISCISGYTTDIKMCRVKYPTEELEILSHKRNIALRAQKWRNKNKEKSREASRKCYNNLKEKIAATNKMHSEDLTDRGVKRSLLGSRHKLKAKEITPELIELQRNQLKLYRDVKKITSGRNNTSNKEHGR